MQRNENACVSNTDAGIGEPNNSKDGRPFFDVGLFFHSRYLSVVGSSPKSRASDILNIINDTCYLVMNIIMYNVYILVKDIRIKYPR
jgi:hypothetical protein